MQLKDLYPGQAVVTYAELVKAASLNTTWCIRRDVREGKLHSQHTGSRQRRKVIGIEEAQRWLDGLPPIQEGVTNHSVRDSARSTGA